MDKVAFVNKISTLMKATSDDATPIQGYLYQEVNKIAYESEGYCESTLEFLVDRLNKQSCHVKFKVLKLMKHVVENGPEQFKMGLIKNSQGIRDATKYSAPDDPLHGNLPNKAVRKIAQELSQLLFNTENQQAPRKPDEVKDQDRSRITGLGSTSMKGSMQGFGNSPSKTKSSFMDKLSRFASSFQDKSKDQQAEILASIESHGDYRPPPLPLTFPSSEEPVLPDSEDDKVKLVPHTPGHAAGGWEDPGDTSDDEHSVKHTPGKAGGGWEDEEEEEEEASGNSSQEGLKNLTSSEITETCEEEKLLLHSLLEKSEELTLKEIRTFISSCHALNAEKVIEMINQQLNSSNHSHVMKCLLLIEYMAPSGLVSVDYICKICQQQLTGVSQGEATPASYKAKKILLSFEKLLGVQLLHSDGLNSPLLVMED